MAMAEMGKSPEEREMTDAALDGVSRMRLTHHLMLFAYSVSSKTVQCHYTNQREC
jgi:hypothetical protein